MKTQNAPTKVSQYALATFSAVAALACLFVYTPSARAKGAADRAAQIAVIDGTKVFTEFQSRTETDMISQNLSFETRRRSLMRVDLQELKTVMNQSHGRPVRLNVFPDRPLYVVFDSIDEVTATNIVATGRIDGDPDSAVSLAINNSIVVANFQSPRLQKRYEVRPTESGLHTIREQGNDTASDCATVDGTRP